MDRTTIIAGPAIVTFDSQVFYTEGDITAKPTVKRFDISTSQHGKSDERLDHTVFEIGFTPAGQWIAGHLPVLWPYQDPTLFSSMVGATDKNLVIQTLAGRQITFKAAYVSAMPQLILSAIKTPIGAVAFKAIGANDTAMSDAAKYVVDAAVAFADTSFDPTDIKTVPYSAAWGVASPWADIETEDGWTVDFNIGEREVLSDRDGLVDVRLESVEVMAKCKPLGVSEAQVLALLNIQGSGVARGVSLLSNSNDLVIDGGIGNPKVTLYNASPVEAGYVFGSGEALRQDELGFTVLRKFTAGAAGALFNVATGVV